MCVIDRPVNGKGLFIKEIVNRDKTCTYRETSVNEFICNCPTRYEIYMHHNL